MIELKRPDQPLRGHIRISGSKSISNRLLIIRELISKDTELLNLSDSEDTKLLAKALARIRHQEPLIDVNHAGTDFRFLTSLLAITKGDWVLTGSESLKKRPVGELVRCLVELGAEISYMEKQGFPPLKISGKNLQGGQVQIDASQSSQFLSSLLLITPALASGLKLQRKGRRVSQPYVDMTLDLMRQFGVEIESANDLISLKHQAGGKPPASFLIESDWSSASYWYSMCALSKGSTLTLSRFEKKSLQADSVLTQIFEMLGVRSSFNDGSLLLQQVDNRVLIFEYDFTHCPDIAQTVALTCYSLGVEARLTGLGTLKLKETDRIEALCAELTKCGADVTGGEDFIRIGKREPGSLTIPASIDTYHDHRMAMSFAPLCMVSNKIQINDHKVVGKSYPDFWDDLVSLGFNVNLQP